MTYSKGSPTGWDQSWFPSCCCFSYFLIFHDKTRYFILRKCNWCKYKWKKAADVLHNSHLFVSKLPEGPGDRGPRSSSSRRVTVTCQFMERQDSR